MTITLGITGSLGTGKSMVTEMFARLGAKVLDADKIVHLNLQKKGGCYSKVVKAFGREILIDGEISRRALAKIVFLNESKLRKLEQIIHPVVKKEILKELNRFRKNKEHIVVVEIPLLFEAKFESLFDYTVVVVANKQLQIKRSVKRMKITPKEAMRRIKLQMPLSNKVRKADIVINNSRSKIETKRQVSAIWQKLIRKIKK